MFLDVALLSACVVLCHVPHNLPDQAGVDRVGQNHIYTVYTRYLWQGNHQIYGHKRCMYTILVNPRIEAAA
jgi:hypothetical protein